MQCGADLVAMIVRRDKDYCGLATMGPVKENMFSVTSWNCATGHFSFGHEVAHNLVREANTMNIFLSCK